MLGPEKEGTVTNTTRLVQWHDKVCEAPGDSRSDLWFVYHLGRRLKQLYAGSTRPARRADPGADAGTTAEKGARREPDAAACCARSTATPGRTASRWRSFNELKDDGSTACGGWMYSGVLPDAGPQPARARACRTGRRGRARISGWAFAWPANRRTLYNRASADPEGKPWSERKKLVWWDAETEGLDRPRRARLRAPTSRPTTGRTGRTRTGHGRARRRRSVHHGPTARRRSSCPPA